MLDGYNIAKADWEADESGTIWHAASQGWTLSRDGDDLLFAIDGTSGSIRIRNHRESALGFDLPKPNRAPEVREAAEDLMLDRAGYFSFRLPDTLFADSDAQYGDFLRYSVTLTDGSALPPGTYGVSFNAATRTVSGYAPDAGLDLLLSATDRKGLTASQNWSVRIKAAEEPQPEKPQPPQEPDIGENDIPQPVYGSSGNDALTGSGRRDYIHALDGDDTLEGGTGNDWLYGGAGDDTYRFAAGDGADWIRDEGGSDSLHFTGLDSRKATWRREGSHLAIYGENGDVVRIHDYFAAAEQRIEHLHFSDRTLDHPDFAAHAQAAEGLIQAMAVFGSGGGATSASADTAAVLQPLLAASSL